MKKMILISKILERKSLKKLTRKMDEVEWKRLVADVKDRGFVNPVTLGGNDVLLDGYHRVKVARYLGLKEIWYRRESPEDVEGERAYIRSQNVARRHLSSRDVVRALRKMKAKAQPGKKGAEPWDNVPTLEEGYAKVAADLGMTPAAVKKAHQRMRGLEESAAGSSGSASKKPKVGSKKDPTFLARRIITSAKRLRAASAGWGKIPSKLLGEIEKAIEVLQEIRKQIKESGE